MLKEKFPSSRKHYSKSSFILSALHESPERSLCTSIASVHKESPTSSMKQVRPHFGFQESHVVAMKDWRQGWFRFSPFTFLLAILIQAWIQKAALAHDFNKAHRKAGLQSCWKEVWVTAPEPSKMSASLGFLDLSSFSSKSWCVYFFFSLSPYYIAVIYSLDSEVEQKDLSDWERSK